MSPRFAGERALVIGAGVAGASAARVLAEEGAIVSVSEARPEADVPAAGELRALGIEVWTGGHDPSHLDGATLVVTAPGVAPHAEVLRWVRDRGLPLWGEMELGARLANVPYLAVTGTNGKTTTTAMVAACLRAWGLDAVACGNIGHPFAQAARAGHEVLVVECSSFQLATQESLRPRVSVLLNLAPDHLDWHETYDGYVAAKSRVYRGQDAADTHVGNRDDRHAAVLSRRAPCPVVWFTLGAPSAGEVGYDGDGLLARLEGDLRLGPVPALRTGYRANAAAAAAAVLSFGASPEAVRTGLRDFVPADHRGEVVAEIGGVRFVDDSKATNVHAALAALESVRDAVLIAGGYAKGADLTPLARTADRLRGVVAIGEAAPDVVRVFEGLVAAVVTAGTIEEAVQAASSMAEPGTMVVLAPACASWDQFRDYAERGDRFAAAARSLGRVGLRG